MAGRGRKESCFDISAGLIEYTRPLCDCAHLGSDSSPGSSVVERHDENNTNSRITIGQEALFTKATPAELPSTARFFCTGKK